VVDTRIVADPHQAAALSAEIIEAHLRGALAQRGEATLAVSGGATPAEMLRHLATAELDWQHVSVFQVDERVAPDGHPDRNANMLDAMSSTAATVLPMPVTATDLEEACDRYAALLPRRFDVIHLGVGPDGHTASWPPGDPVIDAPGAVAMSGEYQGRIRMTFTPRIVNGARFRLMLATGTSKAEPLSKWVAGDTDVPVSRVDRADTVLVVDAAAAPAAVADPDR
jgi:6-phosphogluconolactonase